MKEPEVGIFWLIAGRLVFDSTPVSQAENYADCKNHGGSHLGRWDKFFLAGVVPQGEYEEHPRGRTVFNIDSRQYTIYADRCIIRKKSVVRQIIRQMGLPRDTKISTDPHYRCFLCMQDYAHA